MDGLKDHWYFPSFMSDLAKCSRKLSICQHNRRKTRHGAMNGREQPANGINQPLGRKHMKNTTDPAMIGHTLHGYYQFGGRGAQGCAGEVA